MARRFGLLTVLIFGLLTGSALATPPTLLSAGQQAGVPNATWSLPAGFVSSSLEVAASAQTEADGSFYFQNIRVLEPMLTTDQTSWTGPYPLEPGTYYVHVSDCPAEASFCGPTEQEWSNIASFVVPPAAPIDEQLPPETPIGPLDLTASAQHLVRRGKLDATRFAVTTAVLPDSLVLRLVRGTRTVRVDLDVEDQGAGGDNSFRYTFTWLCNRSGRWEWTIKGLAEGGAGEAAGSFTVPACRRLPWYVSASRVKRKLNRDFDFAPGAVLVCRPTGRRRGGLSDRWSCGLRVPGQSCSGAFGFRARRVLQGRDTVSRTLTARGGVECRG